jgi:prepilin-type N-terminal cleavage/methylation domain-containing protein
VILLNICRRVTRCSSGYTLIEVLVASVIFAGVFLALFTMLGKVLMNASGGDYLRVAQLADERLAAFFEGDVRPEAESLVTMNGIRFKLLSAVSSNDHSICLRLAIIRELSGDTLGVFYAKRFTFE